MAKKISKYSIWRDKVFNIYGKQAEKEIYEVVGKDKFQVRNLVEEGIIPILDHCALSTRRSWLSAICAELVVRGKLQKIGSYYRFAKKRRQPVRR